MIRYFSALLGMISLTRTRRACLSELHTKIIMIGRGLSCTLGVPVYQVSMV